MTNPNYGELAELIELARKLHVTTLEIEDAGVTIAFRATLPPPPGKREPFERASTLEQLARAHGQQGED